MFMVSRSSKASASEPGSASAASNRNQSPERDNAQRLGCGTRNRRQIRRCAGSQADLSGPLLPEQESARKTAAGLSCLDRPAPGRGQGPVPRPQLTRSHVRAWQLGAQLPPASPAQSSLRGRRPRTTSWPSSAAVRCCTELARRNASASPNVNSCVTRCLMHRPSSEIDSIVRIR